MNDFIFRGSFQEIDPEVFELSEIESERQTRRIILIPSESQAPLAVRAAMSTAFQNIYAEGYPAEDTRNLKENELFDYSARLAYYRRYSDPRYYKGVEYADIVEALARRRCAELFAANEITPDEIFVNVQALSGGPANNAVFHALAQPGDTIMGMDLLHGGHLSHGSNVHRSGKYYNAVHYSVDPETEKINYDQINDLAIEHQPKFIIAGFSSYPWTIEWERFKEIADSVNAFLFADIAHVAGLVAAGVFPSPVGIADVITFTTHKTLCGPRGACILTTDPGLSKKIDKAVFPGEQGGPHVNTFAAMSVAFKLAKTEQFRKLQEQVVRNCQALVEKFTENGFRIPFGGTDTHLMNLDCGTIVGTDNTKLSGDQAARILDIAGIVVNRNTIPGDTSALDPSGIRMGTPWVTQRGLKENDMHQIADIISDVLNSTRPYSLKGRTRTIRRAKVDFQTLEVSKLHVHDIARNAGSDFESAEHGYPHFFYLDDKTDGKWAAFELKGEKLREYMNFVFASDVEELSPGDILATELNTPIGKIDGQITCLGIDHCLLRVSSGKSGFVSAWLRDLSDGYIMFDDDPLRKIPGPVEVIPVIGAQFPESEMLEFEPGNKPYFIGIEAEISEPKQEFNWEEIESEIKRTPLYDLHKQLGARMIPFAGWEMPVWYSSVLEEHKAVRENAGLFDVSHMGVYQAEGPEANVFLNCVVGNDINLLGVGESCYTHFLDPDADVIDDLLIYRRGLDKYLIVVNASNDDKDWNWLQSVKRGEVLIDRKHEAALVFGKNVLLRNLRDPEQGEDMRVDIALQGPKSREVLLMLGAEKEIEKEILSLKRTELCEGKLGQFDLIISRTGYTGEKMGFELFIHPERARELFEKILEVGEPMGIKPIGLGARDSLRTEAGLPLYGHEMGIGSGQLGENQLGVAEAGFGSYVKVYKPWFIGREAYIEKETNLNRGVIRFQFEDKGVRMAHQGDPVLDKRGRVIGWVTSCAVDSEGRLTGQAFIDFKNSEKGTDIYIFQGAESKPGKSPAEFEVGDKTQLPSHARVVSRFR